jgi:hypothetical protein
MGARSALWTFSSLTIVLAEHRTAADSTKREMAMVRGA